MPISKFPSIKTSRKSRKTSTRNRSKDWKKSWLQYRLKKERGFGWEVD